jgi:hypothetical protein
MIGVLIHLTSFVAQKSHFLELREIPRIWKVQDKPCQCMSTYVERTNIIGIMHCAGPSLQGMKQLLADDQFPLPVNHPQMGRVKKIPVGC